MGEASLEDFSNFHSMVCNPNASQRCINAFESVVFMPRFYKKIGIAYFDFTRVLNLFTYYWLVWISFTGISTLLGLTKTICTTENMDKGLSPTEVEDITDEIVNYLKYASKKDCKVVRKFEYYFKIPQIHVKMFHVLGNDNKLHLVEIFKGSWLRSIQLLGTLAVAMIAVVMKLMGK